MSATVPSPWGLDSGPVRASTKQRVAMQQTLAFNSRRQSRKKVMTRHVEQRKSVDHQDEASPPLCVHLSSRAFNCKLRLFSSPSLKLGLWVMEAGPANGDWSALDSTLIFWASPNASFYLLGARDLEMAGFALHPNPADLYHLGRPPPMKREQTNRALSYESDDEENDVCIKRKANSQRRSTSSSVASSTFDHSSSRWCCQSRDDSNNNQEKNHEIFFRDKKRKQKALLIPSSCERKAADASVGKIGLRWQPFGDDPQHVDDDDDYDDKDNDSNNGRIMWVAGEVAVQYGSSVCFVCVDLAVHGPITEYTVPRLAELGVFDRFFTHAKRETNIHQPLIPSSSGSGNKQDCAVVHNDHKMTPERTATTITGTCSVAKEPTLEGEVDGGDDALILAEEGLIVSTVNVLRREDSKFKGCRNQQRANEGKRKTNPVGKAHSENEDNQIRILYSPSSNGDGDDDVCDDQLEDGNCEELDCRVTPAGGPRYDTLLLGSVDDKARADFVTTMTPMTAGVSIAEKLAVADLSFDDEELDDLSDADLESILDLIGRAREQRSSDAISTRRSSAICTSDDELSDLPRRMKRMKLACTGDDTDAFSGPTFVVISLTGNSTTTGPR